MEAQLPCYRLLVGRRFACHYFLKGWGKSHFHAPIGALVASFSKVVNPSTKLHDAIMKNTPSFLFLPRVCSLLSLYLSLYLTINTSICIYYLLPIFSYSLSLAIYVSIYLSFKNAIFIPIIAWDQLPVGLSPPDSLSNNNNNYNDNNLKKALLLQMILILCDWSAFQVCLNNFATNKEIPL